MLIMTVLCGTASHLKPPERLLRRCHPVLQVRVTHTVAFATTGHTFFLEDGIETGNVFIGNLGMLTQAGH